MEATQKSQDLFLPPLHVVGGAVDRALAEGRGFAVWRDPGRTVWGEARGGGPRLFARSFDGRPGEGPWAGWPSRLTWFLAPLPEGEPGRFRVEPLVDAEPLDGWRARVEQALAEIAAGRLHKLVVSRARRGRFEGSIGAALVALGEPRPGEVLFAFSHPGHGVALGKTPETLFRRDGRRIVADALAGTGRDAEALLASHKDRREHHWVLRELEARFSEYTRGVVVEAVGARPFGDYFHLSARISGRTDLGADALVDLLHPTPAVGGVPRERALALLEGERRGYYAAPFGLDLSATDAQVAVTLRMALLRDGEATLFGGAGIVAGSEPEAEWRETALKMRTLERAWGAA